MSIFLDSHSGVDLPVDVIRDFLRGARSAATDAFGVRPLDLFCGDDGRVFCIMAAPDEAAIRQHHAAQDVVCRRVRRVHSEAGHDQLTAEEKAVVREMIQAEQTRAAWESLLQTPGEWLRQVG
jgi:hypothetical protein